MIITSSSCIFANDSLSSSSSIFTKGAANDFHPRPSSSSKNVTQKITHFTSLFYSSILEQPLQQQSQICNNLNIFVHSFIFKMEE